jgi:hypothetical protein
MAKMIVPAQHDPRALFGSSQPYAALSGCPCDATEYKLRALNGLRALTEPSTEHKLQVLRYEEMVQFVHINLEVLLRFKEIHKCHISVLKKKRLSYFLDTPFP